MSWTCPKCEREFATPEQRHYCARINLDTLFAGRSPELLLVFDKLLAEVADWDGVLIGTTPNCIIFNRRWTFLVIRPMKKELDIKFYSREPHPEKPILKSIKLGNKYENHIRLTQIDDLRPVLFKYIRTSYQLFS